MRSYSPMLHMSALPRAVLSVLLLRVTTQTIPSWRSSSSRIIYFITLEFFCGLVSELRTLLLIWISVRTLVLPCRFSRHLPLSLSLLRLRLRVPLLQRLRQPLRRRLVLLRTLRRFCGMNAKGTSEGKSAKLKPWASPHLPCRRRRALALDVRAGLL